MPPESIPGLGALAKLAQRRRQSWQVRPAVQRVDRVELDAYIDSLGDAAIAVRRLDAAVDEAMAKVLSLSALTASLALDYLDRLARPVPALTSEVGVPIVTRSYVAHLVVETDPAAFDAMDVPVLGTFPSLRRGSPPQDLLTRVVKATRRNFDRIRAIPTPVWDGFVRDLTRRAHDQVGSADPDDLLAPAVVDGLARFGWVLRQVDLHYGQQPERR